MTMLSRIIIKECRYSGWNLSAAESTNISLNTGHQSVFQLHDRRKPLLLLAKLVLLVLVKVLLGVLG